MFEYAKHEFNNWLIKQSFPVLTSYEKTIINIIINHFDDIAKVGTQKGARAKLLAQYIKELNNQTLCDIKQPESSNLVPKKPQRLSSLSVEKFRGFDTQIDFKFSKQYSFFHGQNGSGKSSFCEALEYSMLGSIEEASSRHIPIDKYILHAGSRKVHKPILMCSYTDGSISQFVPDLATYRFAFVEKNRIDSFSHIGATSPKAQIDRIAALFGLSEFQEFISGFTNSLDDRYLLLNSSVSNDIIKYNDSISTLKGKIQTEEEKTRNKKSKLKDLLQCIGNGQIEDVESAKHFLTNPNDGQISILIKKSQEEKMPIVNQSAINDLSTNTDNYLAAIQIIKENQSIILQETESVNLQSLYKAIESLHLTWKEKTCPACLTPLDKVHKNPFDHAKNELQHFDLIEKAKDKIHLNAKAAYNAICSIKEHIQDYQALFSGMGLETLLSTKLSQYTFYSHSDDVSHINAIIDTMNKVLHSDTLFEAIESYNTKATLINEKYNTSITKLQTLLNNINTVDVEIKCIEKSISEWKKELDSNIQLLETAQKSSEQEIKSIEYNRNMIHAYNEIINKLQLYADTLPIETAMNLSQKVIEYYNEINNGDADFELINHLSLPLTPDDKMIIRMNDNTEQDAMLLLSEGHVRILGLSILLAKAVQEKIPFLIFDDIVNSIDDDHRVGVANLLMNNPDFKDIQMILTCHGEIFVSMLENAVKDLNAIERYMFLPADSLSERGIVIKYRDPSIPLKMAREKYEVNELKDCAAKCRQAVECIVGKLWAKICSYCKDGISVQLRSLNSTPDLKSIADALNKSIKKQLKVFPSITDDLDKLTSATMWNLLNKGTHIDNTIPEFNRQEIYSLLQLVEHLSIEVANMKIQIHNPVSN